MQMISDILTFAGSLVGGGAFAGFLNWRQKRRIAKSEADTAQFHLLQETTLFLQKQLQEKEERFAEQTMVVRRLNTELLEASGREAALKLDLANVRCENLTCSHRLPPNAHTRNSEQ